jgi:hypothetical protein
VKTGAGFFDWTPETIAAEKARYDALLLAGLGLLAAELPKVADKAARATGLARSPKPAYRASLLSTDRNPDP